MLTLAEEAKNIIGPFEARWPEVFPIEHPMGILAVLLAVLAVIFWFGEQAFGKKLFGIVPKLVFCYFVPTTLTTLGMLPEASPLYDWIKAFLLPASLLLLILALDVPGIIRLGPKAGIMLLAGTAGVVIGAPLALMISQAIFGVSDVAAADVVQNGAGADIWTLPADTWQGMTALSGSWIGGGANMAALQQISGCSASMFGLMVVVDVFVANIWMGILLYSAGEQKRIDRWTGADTSAIDDLKKRMAEFERKTSRIPTLTDLIIIVAFGFVGAWVCYVAGDWLAENLLYVDVFLYILVASIGAHANFMAMKQAPALVVMGFIWMAFHVIVLLVVGRLIRAPIFFVAVGSQANIGGAASAPIVASAFHPTLAPVGVLLAVAGYVLGTYAGLLIMWLLRMVADGA